MLKTSVWVFALCIVVLVALHQHLYDPFVYFDDYPILFGWTESYYVKTLTEGRWINYFWQVYAPRPPAWLASMIFWAFWAGYAAIVSVLAVGRNGSLPGLILFALATLLAIPTIKIAPWANTLVPGYLALLLYPLIVIIASRRVALSALVVFIPVSMMTYPGLAPLMLLACAVGVEWRTTRDWAVLGGVFTGAVLLGVAVIYGLNSLAHETFGVRAADWRTPDSAPEAGLVETFLIALKATLAVFNETFLHSVPLALLLPAGALAVGLSAAPRRAAPIVVSLALGIGMFGFVMMLTGITVAARAYTFLWVGAAALFGLGLASQNTLRVRFAAFASLIGMLAMGLLNFMADLNVLRGEFQVATEAAVPNGASDLSSVLIYGDPLTMPEVKANYPPHATATGPWGFALRLQQLTGVPACLCDIGYEIDGYETCDAPQTHCDAARSAAEELPVFPEHGYSRVSRSGALLVRFPPFEEYPIVPQR